MAWDDGIKKMTPEQRALAFEMSDISEECWCAGWLSGCEHDLWRMVLGGSRDWGMGEVLEDQVAELKRLSEACGGWIRWVDGDGETFVPMPEWLAIHAARQKELDEWTAAHQREARGKP